MMVEEQDRKDAVLLAMSDRYMRRVIAATMVDDKSIEDIAKEKEIPVSTCYRRVRELMESQVAEGCAYHHYRNRQEV